MKLSRLPRRLVGAFSLSVPPIFALLGSACKGLTFDQPAVGSPGAQGSPTVAPTATATPPAKP